VDGRGLEERAEERKRSYSENRWVFGAEHM